MDDTTDDTSSTGSGSSTLHDRWTSEASLDPLLAAAEIYFMACPWERLPWRDLLQMSRARAGGPSPVEELFARPPPPPERWAGRRRTRSSRRRHRGSGDPMAAAKEPRRMDSPTTPLSWTTAAASSGSGSGSGSRSGWCEAAREDDADTSAAAAAAAAVVAVPVAGTKRPRGSDAEATAASAFAFAAPPAAAVAGVSPSSYAAAAGAAEAPAATATGRSVLGPTDAAASGTTTDAAVATGSGGGAYASISKTTRLLLGKKMTLVELKCYEQSLLQKNIEMRKELELQRMAQKALVEQNTRLKMLKSKHQPQAARQLFVAAKDEAASTGKCPFLPFDLNMPAAEDTMDPGDGFYCK